MTDRNLDIQVGIVLELTSQFISLKFSIYVQLAKPVVKQNKSKSARDMRRFYVSIQFILTHNAVSVLLDYAYTKTLLIHSTIPF